MKEQLTLFHGGFPCQPFSLAGKRKGTDDERYLWGEMLRAIQEIKPKFVIAENVFGITNIDGGMVFEQVCLDLEAEGYEVQPFIIPAASKNAPHRRDRCWFIATNPNCNDGRSTNRQSGCEESKTNGEGQQSIHSRIGATSDEGDVTNTNGSTKRSPRTSESIKSNGSNGHLFSEQRGESPKLDNRLHEFSRNVTNTNGNGFQQRNGNNEINTSKGGQYALGDIDESIVNGNTSDTERKRLEGHDWKWKRFSINRSDEGLFIGAKDKFISTHTECSGGVQISKDIQQKQSNGFKFVRNARKRNVTNSDSCRQQTLNNKKRFLGQENRSETFSGNSFKSIYREEGWQNFPTQSPICGGNDGIPTELDGITFSKWRAESIKGYGNAIVPQVALELFKVIEKINCNLSK
jgi:DNA (cytosine-5)-methyltransferase 1